MFVKIPLLVLEIYTYKNYKKRQIGKQPPTILEVESSMPEILFNQRNIIHILDGPQQVCRMGTF